MANPQHIKWLLEGVDAWNARREKEDFVPDFEGADIRAAFNAIDESSFARLIPLQGADLRRANLREAILPGSDLQGADLREATLRYSDLLSTNLWGADLQGADLRGADLEGAHLERADLREANLRWVHLEGADLREAHLRGADLRDANVRTRVYSGLGTNDGSKPKYTNLSQTKGLTQSQLNSMAGDSGSIIPEGLERPDWPELDERASQKQTNETSVFGAGPFGSGPFGNSAKSATASRSPSTSHRISQSQVSMRLNVNRKPIVMTGAALLELIAAYKDDVRKNNHLAIEHAEFRDDLICFLDDLSISIEHILQAVPKSGEAVSEANAEEATKWTDCFINSAVPAWKEHLDPEKLGKASAPIGIILTCGAFGYIISGFNPIGFGAGAVVGKWVTGEMTSGVAADKLAEQLDTPDDPQP